MIENDVGWRAVTVTEALALRVSPLSAVPVTVKLLVATAASSSAVTVSVVEVDVEDNEPENVSVRPVLRPLIVRLISSSIPSLSIELNSTV